MACRVRNVRFRWLADCPLNTESERLKIPLSHGYTGLEILLINRILMVIYEKLWTLILKSKWR